MRPFLLERINHCLLRFWWSAEAEGLQVLLKTGCVVLYCGVLVALELVSQRACAALYGLGLYVGSTDCRPDLLLAVDHVQEELDLLLPVVSLGFIDRVNLVRKVADSVVGDLRMRGRVAVDAVRALLVSNLALVHFSHEREQVVEVVNDEELRVCQMRRRRLFSQLGDLHEHTRVDSLFRSFQCQLFVGVGNRQFVLAVVAHAVDAVGVVHSVDDRRRILAHVLRESLRAGLGGILHLLHLLALLKDLMS